LQTSTCVCIPTVHVCTCVCKTYKNNREFYKKKTQLSLGTLLGMFTKFWKATISFIMSVCPHGTTQLPLDRFSWNLILECFLKNWWENSSFITIGQEWWVIYVKTTETFLITSSSILLRMRNVPKKIVEKIKTHITVFNNFFLKNHAIHEIKCKNTVEQGRLLMTMAHVHCMLDNWSYKHTLTICNTYCFSTATKVERTRLNVTLYVHCPSF
jgi:hypothetical protein